MLIATAALVAVGLFAALASYFTMRAQTDPLVLVFLRLDPDSLDDFLIVIRNVGLGPAYGVRFHLDRELPQRVGREQDGPMKSGPLITGVPMLAPGEERAVRWGWVDAVAKLLKDRPVRVSVEYESRARSPFAAFHPASHFTVSTLEWESWEHTRQPRPPSHRIAEALEAMARIAGERTPPSKYLGQ